MAYSRRKSPSRGRRTARPAARSGRGTRVRSGRRTASRGSARGTGRGNVLRIVVEHAGVQSEVGRPASVADLAGAKIDAGRKGKAKF